ENRECAVVDPEWGERRQNIVVQDQVKQIDVDDAQGRTEVGRPESTGGQGETTRRRNINHDGIKSGYRAEGDMIIVLIDYAPEICTLKRVRCLSGADVGAAIIEIGGLYDGRLQKQRERIIVMRSQTSTIPGSRVEGRIAGRRRDDSRRTDRRSDGVRPDHDGYDLRRDTGVSGPVVKWTRAHHDSCVLVAIPAGFHIECPKR